MRLSSRHPGGLLGTLTRIDERSPDRIGYAIAAAIGLVFVLSVFPQNLLLHGVVPNVQLSGDVAAHVIGQRAYLQDSWHWPLLRTTLLDAPDGLNIAMTDSNPLVSLPLKIVHAWLPAGFSAVQLWLAFAYLIQPVAAVFALRSSGETRLVPAVAISLFAIAMPSFLYRHPHSALSSHFLLLMSLGSYFRTTRDIRGHTWLPIVLLVASLLVHPYLAVMTFSLLLAAPVTLAIRLDARWRRAATVIGAATGLTLAAAFVLDYAAADPPGGFGLVSMNGLSPFFPTYSEFLGRNLGFVDATGTQYEGYQYLGTGLLALAAICFVTIVFSTRVYFLRRHFGLLLACLVVTALALSNVVYVGTHKILDVQPVPLFMHQLRASGRLFWPVSYVVLVGCVATTARLIPAPARWVVLLVLATLQLLDSRELRRRVARDLRAHAAFVLDDARLDRMMVGKTRLTLLPIFGCGADANAPEFLQVLLAASMHQVAANTMYVGRFGHLPDCKTAELARLPLQAGELRVFLASDAHTGAQSLPDWRTHCRALNVVSVCSLREDDLAGLPSIQAPTVQWGTRLAITSPARAAILGPGWYTPEPNGVWTVDRVATIVFALPGDRPAGDVRCVAKVQGFTGLQKTFQHVMVSVNGHTPVAYDVPDREDYDLNLVLPKDQLVDGAQVITLTIGNPRRPIDVNVNGDTRQLGVFLKEIEFTPASEHADVPAAETR